MVQSAQTDNIGPIIGDLGPSIVLQPGDVGSIDTTEVIEGLDREHAKVHEVGIMINGAVRHLFNPRLHDQLFRAQSDYAVQGKVQVYGLNFKELEEPHHHVFASQTWAIIEEVKAPQNDKESEDTIPTPNPWESLVRIRLPQTGNAQLFISSAQEAPSVLPNTHPLAIVSITNRDGLVERSAEGWLLDLTQSPTDGAYHDFYVVVRGDLGIHHVTPLIGDWRRAGYPQPPMMAWTVMGLEPTR